MDKQLSKKWASFHIVMIGLFYVVSGIWEWLLIMRKESLAGDFFLLDIYRNYIAILGFITLITGFVFLVRIKFGRLCVIALAWWNIFTAPLFEIWWNIYSINIKGISKVTSYYGLWLYSAIIILIMTAIRLYIIYMLRPSKSGYIFLKKGVRP